MQRVTRWTALAFTLVLLVIGSNLPLHSAPELYVDQWQTLVQSNADFRTSVSLPAQRPYLRGRIAYMGYGPVTQGEAATASPAPIDDTAELTSTTGVTATNTPEAPTTSKTAAITPTQTLSTSMGLTQTETLSLEVTEEQRSAEQGNPLPGVSGQATPLPPIDLENQAESGALEGTIVANRTNSLTKFFVEGQTYAIMAMRSVGVILPRETAVLNLFNCDAAGPEEQIGCYWDPYLVQQDGFYEIFDSAEISGTEILFLREAGAPPRNQVWIQNRTGLPEEIVFQNETFLLAPTSVQEFSVQDGAPVILYVRSCITMDEQTACEWSPKTLNAGMYFALLEIVSPGAVSGSTVTSLEIRPVVGTSGETIAAPAQIVCRLKVPALNIRSGPGLQYEIVAKVRGTDSEPGNTLVVGRSADGQWLSVSDDIAPGGWVTSSPNFMLCNGDVGVLPTLEAESPPPTLTPTPTPVAVVVAQNTPEVGNSDTQDVEDSQEEATPTPNAQESEPAVPSGYAQLVIHNGFQFEMRFTLDQQYRPEEGVSEYDLQPGASVSIEVFPGQIAFTASSPWNGLSGNAELYVEPDQSLALWLRFEPDPGGSSKWYLAWE